METNEIMQAASDCRHAWVCRGGVWMMLSRSEIMQAASELCDAIEEVQSQRDELLAACKEALAFGWFEPEHEPIIGKLKSAIEKAELDT